MNHAFVLLQQRENAGLMIFFVVILSFQAMSQPTGSSLYDNDERFLQLSGAARTALEMRFGKKLRVVHPQEGTDVLFQVPEIKEQFIHPRGIDRLTAIANTLVNDAAADATAQDTQSETAIVLGSGSNVISSFNDSGSRIPATSKHFTGFSQSTDLGTSWTDKGTLPTSTEGDAGDPVLARDSATGTIYLATLGFAKGENIQVFRSTDNGNTFGAPVNATPGFAGTGDFQDKEWIAVDNFPGPGQGNVYLAWRHFSNVAPGAGIPYGIRFARSTDGGNTWGPSQGILIATQGSFNVQGAYPVVGPDHTAYVFWVDQSAGSGTANIIKMQKSTDLGVSFGATANVVTLTSTGVNGDL